MLMYARERIQKQLRNVTDIWSKFASLSRLIDIDLCLGRYRRASANSICLLQLVDSFDGEDKDVSDRPKSFQLKTVVCSQLRPLALIVVFFIYINY